MRGLVKQTPSQGRGPADGPPAIPQPGGQRGAAQGSAQRRSLRKPTSAHIHWMRRAQDALPIPMCRARNSPGTFVALGAGVTGFGNRRPGGGGTHIPCNTACPVRRETSTNCENMRIKSGVIVPGGFSGLLSVGFRRTACWKLDKPPSSYRHGGHAGAYVCCGPRRESRGRSISKACHSGLRPIGVMAVVSRLPIPPARQAYFAVDIFDENWRLAKIGPMCASTPKTEFYYVFCRATDGQGADVII